MNKWLRENRQRCLESNHGLAVRLHIEPQKRFLWISRNRPRTSAPICPHTLNTGLTVFFWHYNFALAFSSYSWGNGTYTLYIRAVGKPGLTNNMSPSGVQYVVR